MKKQLTDFSIKKTGGVSPTCGIITLVPENGESLPEINDEDDDRLNGGATDGEVCDYILNTNTKKFHYAGKSCAPKSDSKNYKEYSGTRDDLINEGYAPCGTCKP